MNIVFFKESGKPLYAGRNRPFAPEYDFSFSLCTTHRFLA